jgi:hypothetical protein
METRIIRDCLLGNRIKLVWGNPKEIAMVVHSTGEPKESSIDYFLHIKYGGFFRIDNNGEGDPDKVKYAFWIRSDEDATPAFYNPIYAGVICSVDFVDNVSCKKLCPGKYETLGMETEAYYKGTFFDKIIAFVSEYSRIPKIIDCSNFCVIDSDDLSSKGFKFSLIDGEENKVDGSTLSGRTKNLKKDRAIEIMIVRNLVDIPRTFWRTLFHEVVHATRIRYDLRNEGYKFPEDSMLTTELTLRIFKIYYQQLSRARK